VSIVQKIHGNKNALAIFGLLFGACFWGTVWYFYRVLEAAGVSGIASSFYSYVIAAILACLMFAKHWRGMFALPKSMIWLGLIAGWTNLSYVLAVLDGQVMRVILLFYLSPLWTLILAHFWLHERTNLRGLLAIVIALLGASIMLYDTTGHSGWLPIPRTQSDWYALSSGMGFALTNVITRKSAYLSIRAKSFAVWLGVVAVSLLCLPLFGETLPSPNVLTTSNWLALLLISIVLVFGTWLVQYGVTQIEANRASVIFLFELVVAAFASYYLAHEVMSMNEWIGGSLIIAAALIAAFNHKD
jgi:drug/metabolite transporter (DMT)-like permease